MIDLFENKQRSDQDSATHNENPYDYYDRSARPEMAAIRDYLNSWFREYAESEQKELKARFETSFSSAFFELFLYQLFQTQGFKIQIHPTIEGSSKRPDFLIAKGELEIYVEAKEAKDMTRAQETLQKKLNQIYDGLNKAQLPDFFLRLNKVLIKSSDHPSMRKVVNTIEKVVSKQQWELVNEQLEKGGIAGITRLSYEDDCIKIDYSLIPKSKKSRGKPGARAIGWYPSEVTWGGSEESIRDSVIKKANRYGQFEKPYLVCVNAIGMKGNGEVEVDNAIWGSLAWSWSEDPKNRDERFERKRDGLFLDNKGPRRKNVTGVLITKAMEFNVAGTPHWLAKNPFANQSFDFDMLGLTYNFVENHKIMKKQISTIGEALKLSNGKSNYH